MANFGAIPLALVLLIIFVGWTLLSPNSPRNRR